MALFTDRRLTNDTFQLDIEGLRRGYYSDKYFVNVAQILGALAAEGYRFDGMSPRELPDSPQGIDVGDIIVEAQIFNRRAPRALIAGVDVALAMIRHASGHSDGDIFEEGWQKLEVVALRDGTFTRYAGKPNEVESVIEIRGRYRDFTLLETPILGVLTRASRIATNVYETLAVSNGKPVLFFPARFDLPDTQSLDGYAYWLAVQRYNLDFKQAMPPLVSTDAQGAWWDGQGVGTVPHAIVACFLADTAASMEAFARHISINVPRIALVDFNNDTVRDSLAVLDTYWPHYIQAVITNDEAACKQWTLNGVRLDTSSNMLDQSLADGDERGVSPRLVRTVRHALDHAWERWDVPTEHEDIAREFCQQVQIVVSGGFNRERIERFEQEHVPVDSYGVGSTFMANGGHASTDFTMDVVRVQINGKWITMAKEGREPGDHPDLQPIDLSLL